MTVTPKFLGRFTSALAVAALLFGFASAAFAQETDPQALPSVHAQLSAAETNDENNGSQTADDPSVTVFPHSESGRYWISGQGNVVFQWHPTFPAKYSGTNSLSPQAQSSTTHVLTLYTAYRLSQTTQVLADVEDSTGGGIGGAFGLGGFTDLDSVRTAQGIPLSKGPYLARLMLRQIIPLSSETEGASRGPFEVFTSLPVRRLELWFGKFSLVDFFDLNSGASDSHLQFLNWTVDNNGAYDYAGNTRGYTDGAIVAYYDRRWAVRFAEALMPKLANGINLDADIARARSENVEFEFHGNFLGRLRPGRSGTVRLLSYVNHGDMGSYREAIHAFLDGQDKTPDVTKHRQQGRIKYGFGANFEQELTSRARIFGRFGWNEGHNESFVYTEVDQAILLGADYKAEAWHRRYDRVGAAFSLNAISGDHREYLALGGLGFLLGDGKLTYGRERIFEGYYTLHVWRGIFTSFDLQHINNPGYNQDRGPVIVPTLRLHVDF